MHCNGFCQEEGRSGIQLRDIYLGEGVRNEVSGSSERDVGIAPTNQGEKRDVWVPDCSGS